MKTNAIADLNPIYARNLLILGAVIAGKAIVSLALSALVGNIMAVDIIASAVLVAVVLLLVRSNVLRSSSSETDDDTAPLFGKDILSSLRAVAIPLAGCLVCQCSLGIGWAAMIFFRTMLLLFADLVLLYIFVDAFLRGRFANWVVGFLDRVVFRDYNRALDLYQQVFRNYMEWFMAFALDRKSVV